MERYLHKEVKTQWSTVAIQTTASFLLIEHTYRLIVRPLYYILYQCISYDIDVNRGTPSEHFSVLSEGGGVGGNILEENKIQL